MVLPWFLPTFERMLGEQFEEFLQRTDLARPTSDA
jgi:hypothetical protein